MLSALDTLKHWPGFRKGRNGGVGRGSGGGVGGSGAIRPGMGPIVAPGGDKGWDGGS